MTSHATVGERALAVFFNRPQVDR